MEVGQSACSARLRFFTSLRSFRMTGARVAEVIAAIRDLPGCRLARMSGSGSTCFAIFRSAADAIKAAEAVHTAHPGWWVRATALGGVR